MIGMYSLVLEMTTSDLNRIAQDTKHGPFTASPVDCDNDGLRESLSSTGRGRSESTGIDPIELSFCVDTRNCSEINTVSDDVSKARSDDSVNLLHPIQARLDALTEQALIASSSDDAKDPLPGWVANRSSAAMQTRATGHLGNERCPPLTIHGIDGNLRPLWYIRCKIDKQSYFIEDSAFTRETLESQLHSYITLFGDTLELMPLAVAIRFENGQYLHCNAAW